MSIQKQCQQCDCVFSTNDSRKKFCTISCAAKFNNKSRIMSEESKIKLSNTMKSKFKNGNLFIPSKSRKLNNKTIKEKFCRIDYCAYCANIFHKISGKQKTCSKKCGTEYTKIRRKNGELKPTGGLRERSGRGKSGWYKGYFCNSTWELAYVIYNIDHSISFSRNTKGYKYYNPEKNKWSTYYPDFTINDEYVEIKGYKSKLNEYKLSGITDKIVTILYKEDMKSIFSYVKEKYSKTIENLYELYEDHRPLYQKICKVCSQLFKTDRNSKLLCSITCAGKYVGKNFSSQSKTGGTCKPLLQYSLEKKFIKQWKSLKEVSTFLNVASSTFCISLKRNKGYYKNFYWEYG